MRKSVRFEEFRNSRNKKEDKRKQQEIRIVYANANGISGKYKSLKEVLETYDAHIATIVETKLDTIPPLIEGYKWITRNRTNRPGGGVAVIVREDILHQTRTIADLEDHDQEVVWIAIKLKNSKIAIGALYGIQESATREEAERQFSQLTTQIIKLKQDGEVILTGDFNAKLQVNKDCVKQTESPNGKLLDKMIRDTDMVALSTKATRGNWTRVNRRNPDERSLIDYIIGTKGIEKQTTELLIDEEGTMRIKGANESDHNTIMMEARIETERTVKKRKIWKLNNKEGWKQFNKQMQTEDKNLEDYDVLEETIIKTLKKTVGQTTITIGKNRRRETPRVKDLRQIKKEKRKEFETACKLNKEEKKEKLDEYLKAQKTLREAIQDQNKEELQQTIKKIIEEGGTKSQNFWKIRRKILGSRAKENYDLITEDGEKITDEEQSKEYIADYFEALYQAREGDPEYQSWTNKIRKKIEEIKKSLIEEPPIESFTTKELEKTIRSLKRRKSTGPDDIPNEIFIEAEKETQEIYRKTINNIARTQEIPSQWQTGEIVRIYKGKGAKGKCSSERGITLASNFGKMFERLINNRATKLARMSSNQAGGQKGRATVDHIRILTDLIKIGRNERKPVYVTFLDVTKAYDKAWIEAILYVLYKEGVKSNLWTMIRKLNEDLTATVQTKHGITRKIRMKDSIRQGGVLSVLLYALLMDEISKEINKKNLGITTCEGKKTGCLLWMDDVAIVSNNETEMEEMLRITNEIAKRYHIEFGKEKSKTIKIGGKKGTVGNLALGRMELDYTDKYKYLGTVINNKLSMKDQIKEMRSKAEGAYQTVLAIGRDQNFQGIEMESIWKLIESCIIPVITYGCETWNPNKKETKEINDILDNILRRILIVPQSTPREVLYIETGLLDIKTMADISRIQMIKRVERSPNEIIDNIDKSDIKSGWNEQTDKIKEKYSITLEDLNNTRWRTKTIITRKVQQGFKEDIIKEGQNKSKVKYLLDRRGPWEPNKREKYMETLSRNECSTILKARTRMIKVKNNYKNMFRDNICRLCKQGDETQEHILERCPELHRDSSTIVTYDLIFSEETDKLKEGAKRIQHIQREITKYSAAPS